MNAMRVFAVQVCLVVLAAVLGASSTGCTTTQQEGPRYSRSYAYVTRAEYDKAVMSYTKVIERDPNNADAYFNRGFAHSMMTFHQLADRDYTRAIELKPDHVVAYENRGTARYRMGQYAPALQDYNKAIELQPNDAIAHENRAWAYLHLKDYDKAWADIDTCRKIGRKPEPTLIDALTKASGRAQ